MLKFAYNETTHIYVADSIPGVRYLVHNGPWTTAVRQAADVDGRWWNTQSGPRKQWLSIGEGKDWCNDLAAKLGEISPGE